MGVQPSVQDLVRAAMQHHQAGRLRDAEILYRQALRADCNQPDATHYLGLLADQIGRADDALRLISRSIEISPSNPAYQVNLAVLLQRQGRYAEAIAHCRRAIELAPGFAEGHANLGALFSSIGEPEKGIEPLRRALALEPTNVKARYNLAEALARAGDFAQSTAEYERILQIDPNHAQAQFGLSLVRLRQGDLARGLEGYEWRWQTGDASIPRRQFASPLWDGGDLRGKTILLYSEQGYGDAIHFSRYAPMVAARGGRVVLECLPGLESLMASLRGVEQIVTFGRPLPAHDVRCPILSLPRVFGTRMESIPAEVPYLAAAADRIEQWRQRLGPRTDGLRIGLAWFGNSRQINNRERSIPPEMLSPLAQVPGVSFYQLQKYMDPAAAPAAPPGLPLHDFTSEIRDFVDTAALMENLDLVISTDTSVPHLAGALGRPVWLLTSFVPDWRWFLDRTDSPWYPTMRLFRQPRLREWQPVIEAVMAELRYRAQ
ncbi:MAG TPA: tetratricopeptide repeat-containing glycosyltransferase family protein [Tepidisphaeraceae bacterium]|nr:tetratricopeptide repeat-containing glycosyltransferase family protein [Tepidisphaeraceae bacterium]